MKARVYTKEIMNQVYEKESCLYWNVRKNRIQKDSLCGGLDKTTGYCQVKINGKTYYNHRILYQIYHNIILQPDQQVDHINRDKTDNRKENLRLRTHGENCCNRNKHKNNKLGIKNIHIYKEYYRIFITINKKQFIKNFRTDKFTLEEVIEIRNKMLLELHGDNASFG